MITKTNSLHEYSTIFNDLWLHPKNKIRELESNFHEKHRDGRK